MSRTRAVLLLQQLSREIGQRMPHSGMWQGACSTSGRAYSSVSASGTGTGSVVSAAVARAYARNAAQLGLGDRTTALLPQPLRKRLLADASAGGGTVTGWLRRMSSTPNKKRWQNFYPKGMRGGNGTSASNADKVEGGGGGAQDSGGDSGGGIPYGRLLAAAATGLLLMYSMSAPSGARPTEVSFQEFASQLLAAGRVARVEVVNGATARVYVRDLQSDTTGQLKYVFTIGSVDAFERKMDEAQRGLGLAPDSFVPVRYTHEVSLFNSLLELLPTILIFGWAYWLVSRQMRQMTGGTRGGRGGARGGPGGFFGMVKANVSVMDKASKEKVKFADVAGCDEAKQEIMEFVDFLKKPNKYKDLGAKIPKGALLVGPPGTGKTLLAKATAGEANVPFLSISGSDFMEMFVGVGPARVRDLFAQARSQAPSIVFIDEIDAIGRARGRGGMAGGNDERENTLNQLLVEMDGFATSSGVVVLAGTNRPDILDRALLRPGRFDRTISVDTPDVRGRQQIFRVHLGKLKLAKEVDAYSDRLAALTPGFSGADIANVCNEAALIAARTDKTAVDMIDFESAIDRVIGGMEKKNKVVMPEERRLVAYHESGHAVVSWFLEHAEPLLKVSIVPRGTAALGFAQYLPNENVLYTTEQMLDRVCATLGGRAAEEVMLGKISTGAQNDLERITQLAYAQVAVYGMNKKVGLVSFNMSREQFDKPYSDDTAKMIDEEVRHFIHEAYQRTLALLREKREFVENMAQTLLKKEVINLDDIEELLGKRPFTSDVLRNIDRYRRTTGSSEGHEGGESGDKKEADKPSGGDDGSASADEEEFRRRVPAGMIVAS